MKVIDLLNKIANGEIPEKIKYEGNIYKYSENYQDYYCFSKMLDENIYLVDENIVSINDLNKEVEIIEEKKKILERVLNARVINVPKLKNIELSKIALTNKEDIKIIKDKLSEIIDILNGGEE